MLILALAAGALAQAGAEPLTTARQVRELTPEEAAKELPVKLRGVVTFFDPLTRFAFLQDATGGIFFFPGTLFLPGPLTLQAGELVEIEGFTWPGGFAPTVEAGGGRGEPVKATILGRAPLPEPAAMSWNALNDDGFHNRYVELRGVVRSVKADPATANLLLEISTRGGVVRAFVPGFDAAAQPLPDEWIDTEARLRGVFSVGGNPQRQRSELRLFVQTLEQIVPDFQAVAAAFAEPARPFQTLMRFDPAGSPEKRVHVEGVVTHQEPGRGVYLRDADRGLWVQSYQKIDALPGDRIGAIGFATLGNQRAMLEDAILRRGRPGPAPEPLVLTVEQARSGLHHGDLVQLYGELVEETRRADVVVEAEGRKFRAELTGLASGGFPRRWKPKSWVRVTGICLNAPPTAGAEAGAPTDFHLLLRSPGDLALLREAPWWTPQRIAMVIGGLLAAMAATAIWGLLLRRRVAQQTAIIQHKLEREVVWEERNRIARELHDTFEQQLAGITMQLEAATTRLADSPESARRSLGLMRAMIQHSRSEARRSVWDLRSHTLETRGLAGALEELAATHAAEGASGIVVRSTGEIGPLPRTIEFHLLRVAQEAVTNALKHGGAEHIEIDVHYAGDAVRLEVRDDGRGFDPQTTAGGAHFGLLGMHERAAKLDGELTIRSAPGAGTKVTLEVRLTARPEHADLSPTP